MFHLAPVPVESDKNELLSHFVGLVVTEFNAERDEDGTLARQFVKGVVRTLEDEHAHW